MQTKPYAGRLPAAARVLIEAGKSYRPKQSVQTWGADKQRLEISYKLINMGPASFEEYRDTLLMLAYQEAMRYNEYRWKYARFEVKLGTLRKFRKDVPETVWFQASSDDNPEVMVYGPGYDIDPDKTLSKKASEILDIAKRYRGKIKGGQQTFRITRLVICIRDVI